MQWSGYKTSIAGKENYRWIFVWALTFAPSVHRPIVDSVRGGALFRGSHEMIQAQLHVQIISLSLGEGRRAGNGSTQHPGVQGKAYQHIQYTCF